MHNTEGRENRTQELACRKDSVQNSDLPNSTEQRARNEAHMLYFSASEVATLWRYTNLFIIIIIIIIINIDYHRFA